MLILTFKEGILLISCWTCFLALEMEAVHLPEHHWIVLERSKSAGCIKCWNFLSGWTPAVFSRGICSTELAGSIVRQIGCLLVGTFSLCTSAAKFDGICYWGKCTNNFWKNFCSLLGKN